MEIDKKTLAENDDGNIRLLAAIAPMAFHYAKEFASMMAIQAKYIHVTSKHGHNGKFDKCRNKTCQNVRGIIAAADKELFYGTCADIVEPTKEAEVA